MTDAGRDVGRLTAEQLEMRCVTRRDVQHTFPPVLCRVCVNELLARVAALEADRQRILEDLGRVVRERDAAQAEMARLRAAVGAHAILCEKCRALAQEQAP